MIGKKEKTKQETHFSKWAASAYAQQYIECESGYFKSALRQVAGPRVLQLGDLLDSTVIQEVDFPLYLRASIDINAIEQASVSLDPAFLPFQYDMLSTVIVPHVLERHELPHQVLREAHRVLMPEGYIILTGFNPNSFLGLQRLFFKRAVCPGNYFTVKRVSDWLQLLGFEIVASSTFQYSPLIKSNRLRKMFHYLNPLGNRWLPMFGGGYMITARKKQPGETLSGHHPFYKRKLKKRRRKLAAAKTHSNKNKA